MIDVVGNLGHRPAIHLFSCSCRTVTRRNVVGVNVARVVEMHQLLQAFDIAIVEELLLEVRSWLAVRVPLASFGGGTLRRRQSHVARGRRLHLSVSEPRKSSPRSVRVRSGPKATA